MDNYKDKYFMRFFLSLIGFFLFFVCAFYSIYYEQTIFLIIPLIVVDVLLLFVCYQSLMYRLALRDKFIVVHNEKIDLSEYYNKKLEKKNKTIKILKDINIPEINEARAKIELESIINVSDNFGDEKTSFKEDSWETSLWSE